MNRGGSTLSMATNGTQGQPGTIARPFSFSMTSTIFDTPVWLSTINIVAPHTVEEQQIIAVEEKGDRMEEIVRDQASLRAALR